MLDRNGYQICTGDRFAYQVGEEHEHTGEVFNCGGAQVIKWDDGEIIAVKDFYYPPTDQKILQRL